LTFDVIINCLTLIFDPDFDFQFVY